MAEKHGSFRIGTEHGSLLNELARDAVSNVTHPGPQGQARRVGFGTNQLLDAVLAQSEFQPEVAFDDMLALGIERADVIDLCIPFAARILGDGWVEDRLSFAEVTVASARLFGLCKTIGRRWSPVVNAPKARSIVLATIGREDHILGPAVLADQLRRRGHSVAYHSNATVASLTALAEQGVHDGMFVSAATTQAFEDAIHVVRGVKQSCPTARFVLGGAALQNAPELGTEPGPDLTTNDINKAMAVVTSASFRFEVVE